MVDNHARVVVVAAAEREVVVVAARRSGMRRGSGAAPTRGADADSHARHPPVTLRRMVWRACILYGYGLGYTAGGWLVADRPLAVGGTLGGTFLAK